MDLYLKHKADQESGLAGWFKRHVLLLPVVVIASYYIGRGLGDTLQLLYLLCGLYSLKYMDLRSHRTPILLLIILLALFMVSVFYPDFSARSLKYWVLYALSGMVLVFTVGSSSSINHQSNYQLLAWVSIALFVGFVIELGYFFFIEKEFHPATQVNGMILATLAPLIFFYTREDVDSCAAQYVLFYLSSMLVLVVADSRTELLMLLLGGAVYLAFYGKKISSLLILMPTIVVVSIIADDFIFNSQLLTNDGDVFQWLNQLSSKRLEIWAEALAHPPENYLSGVGMRRSIEFLPHLDYVKHLHNMFVEIWYETGLLGFVFYMVLLFALLLGLPRAYQMLEGSDRRVYSIFLASGVAALIAGLLDKGYLHPITRYYMLFCFVVLYCYHYRNRNAIVDTIDNSSVN